MPKYERSFSQKIFRRFAQLRFITGALCLLLGLQFLSPNLISDFNAAALLVTGIIALFGAALQIALLRNQRHQGLPTAYAFILLDCFTYGAIAALGTIAKGYGAFLVLPVLAGALTLRNVHAYVAPALISIAILAYGSNQMYLGAIDLEQLSANASLGVILFFVALVTHLATRSIASAESRASSAEVDSENLERLNQNIIQQLPQGVICVDQHNKIQQTNTLANSALPNLEHDTHLDNHDAALGEYLRLWRHDPSQQQATIQLRGEKWRCEFQAISDSDGAALILLDSDAALRGRERAKRLAGLGQLTAAIAHEIRNPLAAIMQASELLPSASNNDESAKLTNIISSHGRRLNTIVDNILQLTRHKQLNTEVLTIQPWLEQYVSNLNGYHRGDKQFEFSSTVDAVTEITVSPSHVTQMLDNLCNNALHYGQAPYELVLTQRTPGRIDLIVRDHGTGIPTDIAAQAFAPFVTSSGKGTGLGLYICQELAKINNFQLHYHPPNASQKYCEFVLSTSHQSETP